MTKKMNEITKFSVIIPTHRRNNLLRRALESIKKQSDNENIEIIVVSDTIDHQTDSICFELLESQDTYIRRSGKPGPSISRNIGIELAKGKNILFLDDDDKLSYNFFENLKKIDDLNLGIPIYCDCEIVSETRDANTNIEKFEHYICNNGRLTDEVYIKNQISNSCLVYPNNLIKDLKFDEHLKAYEDWDFFLSVRDRIKPHYAPILGPIIYEVHSGESDRRGSQPEAKNLHAVIDYLYIYRRHPAPSHVLKEKRSNFLQNVGLLIDPQYL